MRLALRILMAHASFFLLIPCGLAAEPEPAGKQLHALFAAEWEWRLRNYPDVASILGYRRHNARWPDLSLTAFEERQRHRQEVLQRLKAIASDQLSPADRQYAAIFRKEYEVDIEAYDRGAHLLPLSHMEGIHDLSPVLDSLQFETVRDYEDWLTRLRTFPTYVDQTIHLMQEGTRHGRVQTQVTIRRVAAVVRRLIVDDPEKSPLFKPFRKFPAAVAPAEQERLARAGQEAVGKVAVPAYRKLLGFLEGEYLTKCYDGVGVWHVKDGDDFYRFQVRLHTTTDLTAEEIHEIGHKEVRRIRREMDKVIAQVGFKGTFQDFVRELRTNPKYYYKTSDELFTAVRQVCRKVEGELPKLFGRLPRTRFLIEPVPAFLAPDAPMGYYLWPSADGRRQGTYFINLYKPEVRPKYQLEALSLHEAIPGHHLQIALAFELEGLPPFRRYSLGYNAFVEGWALYSESLGDRLGVYQDPYSKFGQLSFEIWRAVRLVVDTGMHAKKWTRRQAVEFATANSADSPHEIDFEIDRFAAWPAQALSYKIGELKIKGLRAEAERQLKEKFDLRAFHDAVLGSGAVPLDVLDASVKDWIARQRGPRKDR